MMLPPGTVPVPVTIANDCSAGALVHMGLIPPATPVPTVSVEILAKTQRTDGALLGQHKLTTRVRHKGKVIALDGHDCGGGIMDLTPQYPVNAWYAVCWPLSSRKMVFSASKVRMHGTPTGCADAAHQLPFMTCGDPMSGPTGVPVTNWRNSVRVGITKEDIEAGQVKILTTMALDAAFGWVGGRVAGKILGRGAEKAASAAAAIGEEYLGRLFGETMKGFVAGGADLAIDQLRSNPTYACSAGAGPFSVDIDISGDRSFFTGGNFHGR